MKTHTRKPFASIIEYSLIFFAFAIFDIVFPSANLFSLQPHPFWIPVLLATIQFGRLPGVTTAVIAIGLYAALFSPERRLDESLFQYTSMLWATPAMWLVSAIFLGGLRDRQVSDLVSLEEKLSRFEEERAAVGDYLLDLETTIDELQRETVLSEEVAEPDVLKMLLELKRIDYQSPSGVELHTAITRILGDCTIRLYLLNPDWAKVLTTYRRLDGTNSGTDDILVDWDDVDQLPIGLRRSDASDTPPAGSLKLIRSAVNGKLSGILEIQDLTPVNSPAESTVLLDAIASAIASSIDRQSRPASAKSKSNSPRLQVVT